MFHQVATTRRLRLVLVSLNKYLVRNTRSLIDIATRNVVEPWLQSETAKADPYHLDVDAVFLTTKRGKFCDHKTSRSRVVSLIKLLLLRHSVQLHHHSKRCFDFLFFLSLLSFSHIMMSTGYSTLFSLGLSNIHTSFPRELDAAGPNSAITPITLSATPSTPSSSCPFSPPPPKIQIDTQLPNFHTARRRRSSVTAAQSPLASMGVKSPGRSASRAAASPAARTRHRRSESDAILRLKASSSLDVQRFVCLLLNLFYESSSHDSHLHWFIN